MAYVESRRSRRRGDEKTDDTPRRPPDRSRTSAKKSEAKPAPPPAPAGGGAAFAVVMLVLVGVCALAFTPAGAVLAEVAAAGGASSRGASAAGRGTEAESGGVPLCARASADAAACCFADDADASAAQLRGALARELQSAQPVAAARLARRADTLVRAGVARGAPPQVFHLAGARAASKERAAALLVAAVAGAAGMVLELAPPLDAAALNAAISRQLGECAASVVVVRGLDLLEGAAAYALEKFVDKDRVTVMRPDGAPLELELSRATFVLLSDLGADAADAAAAADAGALVDAVHGAAAARWPDRPAFTRRIAPFVVPFTSD